MSDLQGEMRKYLIKALADENPQVAKYELPNDPIQQKQLLRALFNIREPQAMTPDFQKIQDEYLQNENQAKGVVRGFKKGLSIWQGDITRLQVDAIVNAANNQMTGCYIPNHSCIDNAIHTYAGIELRNKCNEIMEAQGYPEPVGQAKITPGYNLPAKYVIHTVGPAISDKVTPQNQEELASCYRSALELADQAHLHSIAFPCISTGVFHFPNELAAKIAVQTTRNYLTQTTNIEKVIFNVFKDQDRIFYERLLQTD